MKSDFKSEMREELKKYIHLERIDNVDYDDEAFEKSENEYIDSALSSILALIGKRLPKEKQKDYAGGGGDQWMWEELRKEGFNQCLSEIKRKLGLAQNKEG